MTLFTNIYPWLTLREPLSNWKRALAASLSHYPGISLQEYVGLSKRDNTANGLDSGLAWRPRRARLKVPIRCVAFLAKKRGVAIRCENRLAAEYFKSRRAHLELIRGSLDI